MTVLALEQLISNQILQLYLKVRDPNPDPYTLVPEVFWNLLKAMSSTENMVWGDQDSSTEAFPLLRVTDIL